jgi:hypothetical protein
MNKFDYTLHKYMVLSPSSKSDSFLEKSQHFEDVVGNHNHIAAHGLFPMTRRFGCIPPRRILFRSSPVSVVEYGTVSTIPCKANQHQEVGVVEETHIDIRSSKLSKSIHSSLIVPDLHELDTYVIGMIIVVYNVFCGRFKHGFA